MCTRLPFFTTPIVKPIEQTLYLNSESDSSEEFPKLEFYFCSFSSWPAYAGCSQCWWLSQCGARWSCFLSGSEFWAGLPGGCLVAGTIRSELGGANRLILCWNRRRKDWNRCDLKSFQWNRLPPKLELLDQPSKDPLTYEEYNSFWWK